MLLLGYPITSFDGNDLKGGEGYRGWWLDLGSRDGDDLPSECSQRASGFGRESLAKATGGQLWY